MVLTIILIVLMVVMLVAMGYFYFFIFPKYESHWKAAEHELNEAWLHINALEYNENDEDQHGRGF